MRDFTSLRETQPYLLSPEAMAVTTQATNHNTSILLIAYYSEAEIFLVHAMIKARPCDNWFGRGTESADVNLV